MNIYLKLFLATSIPFGIFIGIFTLSPISGLLVGPIYGIIITLILGILHNRSVKKMGYKINEKTTNVHQIRNFDLSLPYDKAFGLCLHAIYTIKRSKIKMHDQSKGIIDARSVMKWNRNPCKISLKLTKIVNNKTHIELSSKPLIPTGIVDFGTSLENVGIIIHFLKKNENRFLG
jgi:hypothetical protein